MDDEQIEKLFRAAADKTTEEAPETRAVLSLLVASTLRYRDQMKEQAGVIVTVKDVRVALDLLSQVLHTRQMPHQDNPVRSNLLRLWLEELAPYL